jgi:hypothetical protein
MYRNKDLRRATPKTPKEVLVATQTIEANEVRGLRKGWPTSFYTIILNQDLDLLDETAIIKVGKLPCMLLSWNTLLIDGKKYKTADEAAKAFDAALTLAGLKTETTVIRAFSNRVVPVSGSKGTLMLPDIYTVSPDAIDNKGISSCKHLVEKIKEKLPNDSKEYCNAFLAGGRFCVIDGVDPTTNAKIKKTGTIGVWKGGPFTDILDPDEYDCMRGGDGDIGVDGAPCHFCVCTIDGNIVRLCVCG